jgi:hypothetical protein
MHPPLTQLTLVLQSVTKVSFVDALSAIAHSGHLVGKNLQLAMQLAMK